MRNYVLLKQIDYESLEENAQKCLVQEVERIYQELEKSHERYRRGHGPTRSQIRSTVSIKSSFSNFSIHQFSVDKFARALEAFTLDARRDLELSVGP